LQTQGQKVSILTVGIEEDGGGGERRGGVAEDMVEENFNCCATDWLLSLISVIDFQFNLNVFVVKSHQSENLQLVCFGTISLISDINFHLLSV